MKKFLLMAVAAMGLLFTACSKDEVAQSVAEKSTVTFSVAAPELSTRAHGDGESATALAYAVYNRADKALLFQGTATMSALKATVEIPFVNGMTYDVLFWAEAPAPESPYTVDWDAKTVGYTDAAALVSNSEKYDAFYYFLTGDELPEITGPVTKTVELKRPFAQLNIKTNDAKEAAQSGVVVENVKVVVKNGYSSFDLAAGAGKDKNDVAFGFAAKQENANAEGVQLLAVNYLFTGGEKSLVDVEFTYTDVNGKVAAAGEVMEFASVPVQRNYRTNIVGSLLTSDGKFNIETKPGFEGEHDHSVAVATPEDINALIQNPEVTTVELGAGVYNIDLYNLNEKPTLTINGTEGTQIKFENQQVRASQFDELVINNCEILKMATKSWGHLVFGSSDNAAGVYTISNCTFNGVGTQGIYINETVSGVTYNILNCTFNGDFGGEGAITIQNNNGVNHTVNVLGCSFNSVPATSNKIFVKYDYLDFILNTDLKATTTAELKSFVRWGVESINLANGTYDVFEVDNLPGKTVTIVGESKENTILKPSKSIYPTNSNITLKNLSFIAPTGKYYSEQEYGFVHQANNFNLENCIVERLRLNVNNASIDNCQFNVPAGDSFDSYGLFYYGDNGSKVVVSNSNFTTEGKAVVMYSEQAKAYDLTVNNCTFTSSNPATDKAAIQMHTEYGITGKLAINNSTATGFAAINNGLYNELNNQTKTPTHNFNITVDGKVASTLALKAALKAGETNIELMPATYDAGLFQVMNKTLSLKGIGDGVKIFISQNNAVAYTTFDGCNVTFENLTIETLGGIYKGFARMEGTYNNCTFVNNYFTFSGKHEFTDCTFNAPALTGSFQNEHCMWTYGAEEVDFVNCEFNYSDRGVNVYVDNYGNAPGITSDVAFTNCVFNTTNTSSEGAVEINSSPFTAGVTVALTGCTAPAYGNVAYISPWDGTHGATATVTVNGVAL